MKINKTLKVTLIIIFVVCICMMIYLVFTPNFPIHMNVQSGPNPTFYMLGRAPINYIPFQEMSDIGFWLNMIMTMPVGGLILLLSDGKINFKKVVLCGLLVGLFIELMQFVLDNLITNFKRFVDINDVISNMLGIVIGFYLLLIVIKLINKIRLMV